MLTIQIISGHEQLQAKLRRNIHVWNIFCVLVLFIVVKVLADLFEHDAAIEWSVLKRCTLAVMGPGLT